MILEVLSYKIDKPRKIKNPKIQKNVENPENPENTSRMSYESHFMFWEKEDTSEEGSEPKRSVSSNKTDIASHSDPKKYDI